MNKEEAAKWAEHVSGRSKSKTFSCTKYGDSTAKQLAIQHRCAMCLKQNEEGANYYIDAEWQYAEFTEDDL